MANLFQAWDEDIQALGAAKASDDQIEARRQQLAEHFKAKAKAAGLSSKKINETLDQFDTYSRQKTTNEDNRLSPEEEEMAQRVKDGTERTGAMLEVGKRFKDIGLGALSSLTRMGGDIAQTWADVGDNDKSELSSQIAQGLYNVTDDIRSNYSEGTKRAKKDFWSPEGLTMGLAENLGQIAGSATVFGAAGKLAAARGLGKAATLATMGAVGAPLAYSQGYGQGKENSLDEINKTSNAQLWENVKAEAKAYDDAGGTGEVPYLVSMFKEAGGDLNLMKDLMAENAGNVTGLMTVATEPLAMGVGSLMSRGAAAGGTGLLAKATNWMNNQGMSNELARRIAAGASAAEARKAGQVVATSALRDNASIASQAAKVVAMQGGREGFQETGQEGGEGYIAKTEGSLAAGRKGELTSEDWSSSDGNGIIQQGLQGGAIGLLMGGGGAMATLRHSSKLALEKNGLPEKHDAAIIAKEQADINLAKATEILDLNPEDIKAQEVHAKAYDEALVATNNLEQLTGKFNALYTPEEQAVIKAKTMEGVAARAKVAEDAAKAQKELDDAQAKEQADIAAQQAEAIKTQRDAVVNNLAGMVGDDVALSNAVADLGLSEEEANSLLDDAHKVAKKQKKEAAKQPAPATATPKTPLEAAVDEAFNADGTRNPKAMTSDIAKKHNIPLKPLVDAIGERIAKNEKTNQQKSDEAAFAERQAEISRQSAKKASQAQKAQKDAEKSDVLSEKQQLENTLADFAANNDHDSMVNFLRDYDPKEADTLIANAYKTVANRTKAEQDSITASQKAEAAKAKKAEDDKQAEQKKIAFNNDMADLYAANPDRNPTKAELDSVGKKHGVKSPIELAKAWVKVKNEASGAKKPKETLALPAPKTVMVGDAQGNVTPTTENNVPKKPRNNDFSVPSGLKVDISNAENTRSDLGKGSYIGSAMIVRQDGKPFPTEQVAQQALTNKATKKTKAKKNEPVVSKDTHTVVPVDGGYAIAPVEEVKSVVNQGVTEIKQEPTQAKPKTDAKQINTIGSKEDGLIASKFREDLKSFLTKIDEIDGYENEPSDIHKFSTILTNEILQKRAKNQDDLKGFISKSLDMALDESNYVGLEGAFNDRSRINAVEEFLYEKAKSTGSLSFENKEGDLVKKDEPIVTKVEQPIIDDPSGDYVHSQFHDATATVSKTEKGYDINWGDEVQSFTGKNAAEKTQAALKKEGFSKKNPDNDNGGVPVEPVAPKPVSPTGGNSTPQTTPKTDAEQIASAMDKTAQAITDAAHNKVVERIKNGEEIVYKQPAAVERVKQDDRYQVEINDKGHAVVKNIKDAQGNWVKPDMSNQSTQAEQRVEKKTEIKDEPKKEIENKKISTPFNWEFAAYEYNALYEAINNGDTKKAIEILKNDLREDRENIPSKVVVNLARQLKEIPSVGFEDLEGFNPFSRKPTKLKNRNTENKTNKPSSIERRRLAFNAIREKLSTIYGYENEIQSKSEAINQRYKNNEITLKQQGMLFKDLAEEMREKLNFDKQDTMVRPADFYYIVIYGNIDKAEQSLDDRMQNSGGYYSYEKNKIAISSLFPSNEDDLSYQQDPQRLFEVFAHELGHAITHQIIEKPKTEKQKEAKSRLEALFSAAKTESQKHDSLLSPDDYGLFDIHEFISEAFSRPDFQAILNAIPYQSASIWENFVEIIAKVFGVSKGSMLDEFIAITSVFDDNNAVVKNVKDSSGEWVKQEEKTEENNSEVERIASLYAAELGHPVSKRSREFANDILNKNAYGLEFLANGMNDKGKKVFTEVTGISLPKQQGATWKVIRDWAGVSDEQENHRVAMRDVAYAVKAFMRDNNVSQDVADKNKELIASKIAEGFNSIEKIGNNYWFTDGKGQGINLSEKPKKGYLGLSKSRALIEAMIAEAKAAKAKEINTKDKAIFTEEAKQDVKEAVHIENGKAEEVTPEIIRESLAKVDDKPINGLTMSLKQGKQWLLDEANTALAAVKNEAKAAEAKRVIAVAKAKEELAVAEKALEDNKVNDDSAKLREAMQKKQVELIKAKTMYEPERDYVTFNVPNDGSFKVLKTVSALESFIKKVNVNRGFDKQSPKKLFPAVPQNSVDTTIAEFLGDGEVENAYEFAKLQDKPIRFGVGQLNGKPIALAYALAEPVDLGSGFKGFVGLSLDKKTDKKEWMFIEENSRLSIGFGSITKQGVIKEAKDRLAQLSNDQKANLLKNSPKLEKTDAELEQQWLSQIGYNPNQNEDEVKTDVKAKVEDKQNKAIGDEILNQQPEKVNTKAVDEKPTDGIIKVEYPTAIVLNGWQNSVRNANEVVRSFKRAYEDYIQEAYNGALSQAETDAQRKVLERESLKLQQEYIKRTITLAKVRSGVTSSFIAGRANFNAKQSQSRGNAFDKAAQDFDNWLLGNKYTLSTAVQEARSPEQLAAIKAEKDAKAQKLQDKNDDFLRKVLSFKKGDDFTIGKNKVVRVNVNKYGMPISLTLEGVGITKGLDDKINLFGKNTSYETVDDLKQNIERIKEADNAIADKAQPQQSASEPIISTSSNDLTDKEYIALKKAYNDFKAKTDKIGVADSRDVALEIATGLVAEMPDKEDKIRQALIDAIRENQWNRFEINFPRQPIKVETDVELNRALKRLQKALEGTDYTVNGTFNGKSAKLLFSYKSGANGSRESVLIDRVNGKFTSYHVDFDNMSREFLKPLMDATVKWLNGEEISKMKLGEDSQWDYTTLLSTPRHIDNAFNEAKANAPTVSKSDKLAQSYDEAKTKIMEQRQSESRAEKMADHKKRIDALPIGVRRALSYDIYKEIAESKGDYVDGTYPVNLEPNDISDMTAYYKEKANKEPRNKGVTVGYGDSKDYALDRKALRELADNGLYSDSYLGDNKAEPKEKQQQNPAKEEAQKQETNSKTPTLDKHNALMDSVRDGKATAEDFKQSFADVFANKDAILTELNALTKDQLLKEGGYAVQYRHKNDKKSEVAEAVYDSMIAKYALGRGITSGMGKNSYENAVKKMVDDTDQARLDDFAKEYKQMIDDRAKEITEKAEALKNPQTLEDYRNLVRSKMADGSTRQEAFLTLTPEQRIKYDELEAESTKEAREARKRVEQAKVNTASQATDGKIIETKHTRDGYDLFVVQLSDRLSTDDYKQVLSEAKRLGGWYSSFRGNGAIAGFQFKDKGSAEAFLALAGGDTTAAKEQLSQKQDDYADNRSQSAAERLLDMAEKIEAKANEELDRDRKANTARRARFAMSAENEARAKIALAKTMRNIAEAIKNGKAKFLDNIRMKVDVEALRAYITTAKDNEIRSEYDSYAEQVKRKGQPPTAATADFATYPTYTLFRSDLAFLGRQLLEIDGLKKLGQQIMAVADDVSDAYLEFAKKNLFKVSRFSKSDSSLATFSSKEMAERSIRKSGLTGKAIVLQVKRGENIIILSPSEAINLKVWEGDADKRITLKREFGNQLVESVGRRAGKNNRLLPYQFQYAYDKLKALSRIGIETPSEFRSALREFIALQEQVVNNKVREMELAMVGRKNDGLDFFPTSPAVVAEMLDAAEIQPGMRVLEPSAGMGHIADQIREQAEIDPDVVEFSPERRELLKAKGHNVIGNDFLEVSRKDALPVSRSELVDIEQFRDAVRGDVLASVRSALYWFDRGDYEGAASLMDRATRQAEFNEPAKQKFGNIIERLQAAAEGQYDRIIMNPPFSNRQDAEHVRHAYELLRPNGRIVAIMGEGVFFGSDKKAVEFREWLESVGGTSEKLPDNSFMDKSLPVNTGVNARMVIIDKQDNDNQTNEDKPKFSRKATESDSVPIYRIDNKNFDANNIKPHGLYVSIPSDVSTFDSPHKDVGDTSFAGNASPKNPLNVESFKIQHKRGNDYPMEVSAGVSALKQLVSVQLFERLIKADKAELTATIKEQFPDIDTSQYYDAYELLEVLGAQLAIQEGYDAIIQKNGNDPFNEMVILDNSIIESMSPTDKPKNSKGTGTGLTTTQVRATLVDRFGEKLIKALESSGLLKILETMGDIPSQALKSIQAFHGTPYHFDRFSLSHLGKGEGAQAYGWGLYFAGNKKIAEWYRETLTRPELDKVAFKGKEYGFMDKDSAGALALVNALVDDGFSRKHSIAAIMAMREHSGANLAASFYTYNIENKTKDQNEVLLILNTLKYQEPVKKGQLYKVNISQQEESFLDYDKSLDEQTPYVRDILSKLKSIASLDHRYAIGANFYHALRNEGKDKVGKNPTDKEVSLYLNSIGIHGIKYLDGTSRFAGEGNYNYVIFDDAAVDIVETFYSENPNGIEGYYHNGQATLIADNLTPETVVATFVHELGGHKGFQELMTPTAYDSLMRQFNRLVKQGNPIALAAKARAEAAESTDAAQQDEMLPYLLTQQATLNATRTQQSAVAKVIEQVYRAVKAWLYRTLSAHGFDGLASRLLQPKDITLLAERMIREMGNGTKPTSNKAKGSQFSQLNTPQTQINAVRKKYEGTSQWMKAPNGEPTKLNEVQWLQVRTPNFKEWFGDWENDPENASKAVDENGEPMVVYHGTNKDFTQFNKLSWVAYNPSLANDYAELKSFNRGGNSQVIATFVRAINPFNADLIKKIKPSEKYPYGLSVEAFIDSIENQSKIPRGALDNLKSIIQKGRREEESGPTYSVHNFWNDAVSMFGFEGKNAIDQAIKDAGFDSIFYTEQESLTVGFFESEQIKSAIGNNGDFNPTNPDIRFSRKAKNPITEGIKTAANDAKNSLPKPISSKIDHFLAGRRLPSADVADIVSKTELSVYHRTVGTQQNTALQLPDFKKVYDMAQRYLQHVAVDAYAALQAAPNLLGQLESWSDLKKEFRKAWPATYIKQKTDRAAVAAVIFDETLNNELLSEEDILKALSRDQRKIYKEARDAIEVSLKNTAKSEMVRKLLAAEAINWTTVEDLMDKNLPVEQFAQSVRDLVESRIGGLSNELEAILDSDKMVKKAFKTGEKEGLSKAQKIELKKALAVKAQIDTTKEALKSLNDVEKRLDTLLEKGYAPLMRFGEYTLTVRGLDDKVKSFFMFETKAEQARAANAIVARYGKTVNLETDMISKEEFKQFAGMTPETMALFAKETGMDKDEAYQHYLKLAIPARSAMTRMIKRKGTEGFSDDIQRVVASFVMSNARMAAKNIYAAQIEKSIQAIESGKSVKDQAIVMKENVFNPKENFAQLRNILFLWNLGGSIFFGLLNMTQPYLQTLPHLSQYVSIADAGRAILRGSKIAGVAMKNGHAPRGYEEEYNRAVREGHVDPQNVFMLSGVERGKTGLSNSWTSVASHLMGSIAQVTESFNRKAVFIASIDVANKKGAAWLKKHGFDSAYDFAVDSIAQTQGVYNKANRSNWANTSVGAPLMTFKQFSINYVEQMVRMWRKKAESGDEGKKAVFLMLAMLASLSGVMGLPFIKDILDVSETTAAFLGNPVNIEREARLALGKDLADPLFNGALNHFVFNQFGVDTQSRTSMGDLIPLSNIFNPTLSSQGRANELSSIAGATGGLIEKGYDASQLVARGELGTAALTLMPRSLTSAFTGAKMALTDEVMDSKGNKIFDTTWDEGLVKFIDANPKRMADLSRTKPLEWKDFAIQDYMTTSFKQKIINAMMDKDQAEVNKLMKEVEVWNNARSRYPVYIDLNTLAENANKKDQTFDAREKIRKGMTWVKNERPEM